MIPDGITPKAAWRAWRLQNTPRGTRLTSANHLGVWEPGVPLRAVCAALGEGTNLMVNVLDQGRAAAVRNHMAQQFTPPVYEVDEGENRVYFTKKSYLVVPRPVPVALRIPSIQCSCGIYATNDINEALTYGQVLGRVALWGHVVIHQSGFRAQFAYPQSLYLAPHHYADAALRADLEQYGVPILTQNRLPIPREEPQPEAADAYDDEDGEIEVAPPPAGGRSTSELVREAIAKFSRTAFG